MRQFVSHTHNKTLFDALAFQSYTHIHRGGMLQNCTIKIMVMSSMKMLNKITWSIDQPRTAKTSDGREKQSHYRETEQCQSNKIKDRRGNRVVVCMCQNDGKKDLVWNCCIIQIQDVSINISFYALQTRAYEKSHFIAYTIQKTAKYVYAVDIVYLLWFCQRDLQNLLITARNKWGGW